MIDRAKFFAAASRLVFGGSLSDGQTDGLGRILNEWDRHPQLTDLRQLAYIMATPQIETGGRYQPIRESLNYSVDGLLSTFGRHRISEADARSLGRKPGAPALDLRAQEAIGNILYGGAFGRDQLGNTEPGDGWRYRGRGIAQITGRRNYTKFGQLLGVALASEPDLALDPTVSTKILVTGLVDGLFTGRKLAEFFPAGAEPDWKGARRTLNGQDRAEDIASVARRFLAALTEANVAGAPPAPSPRAETPAPAPVPPPPDLAPPERPQPTKGFCAEAFAFIRSLKRGA